eukprot:4530999-Prymnesium_polylepis.1
MSADKIWPPRTLFGCDAGAAGSEKRRTATAPRGGQRQDTPCGLKRSASASSSAANPAAAPSTAKVVIPETASEECASEILREQLLADGQV